MRAVLYTRCSTQQQQVEAGAALCRAEITRGGWALVAEHIDHGISGTTTSRPALDALMAQVHAGEVDAVVVPAADRLGRNAVHVLQLEQQLRRQGVALVLLREGIDSSTPIGLAVLGVLAVWAQLERSFISERTRAHMAHKRRQWQPDAVAVTDEQIRALRRKEPSLSVRALAARLSAAKSTVHRALGATS